MTPLYFKRRKFFFGASRLSASGAKVWRNHGFDERQSNLAGCFFVHSSIEPEH